MTPQQYHEANIKLQVLKSLIRGLVIGSKEYNERLLEITRLDKALKLCDASMPTYSGHTKLN